MSSEPCGCDQEAEWLCERHRRELAQEGRPAVVGLPTDAAKRKALPIWSGVMMYFPDALAAVAEVSRIGNDQHNPGQPLHWDRAKSTDQMNTAIRHAIDYGVGVRYDVDGARHLAKAAWRLLAELQLDIEKEREER